MALTYRRTWALDDIEIMRAGDGGDGRTVTAYAAVFDHETEIADQYGRYRETIHRSAFNRTAKSAKPLVLYNHGLDLQGKPNIIAQVPIGKTLEIRPDGRGLLTVVRYNGSDLADATLEAIRAGDVTGYSFRGSVFRSNPMRPPRPRPGQPLPLVTRMELGITDYGPTPRPFYQGAEIVAVRSAAALVDELAELDPQTRADLIRALSSTTPPPAGPETTPATPAHAGPGAADPHQVDELDELARVHSGRLAIRRARIRAEMIRLGVRNHEA